jgi:hypothetical protein
VQYALSSLMTGVSNLINSRILSEAFPKSSSYMYCICMTVYNLLDLRLSPIPLSHQRAGYDLSYESKKGAQRAAFSYCIRTLAPHDRHPPNETFAILLRQYSYIR